MFLLFLIKMFATHLKPKRRAAERRVGRVSGHRQVLMMAIMIGWWWWWWLVDDGDDDWLMIVWWWGWHNAKHWEDQALGHQHIVHFMCCAFSVHTYNNYPAWYSRLSRQYPSVHLQLQLMRVEVFVLYKLNSQTTHRLPSHLLHPHLKNPCPPFPPPTLRLSPPLPPPSTRAPHPSTRSCPKGAAQSC